MSPSEYWKILHTEDKILQGPAFDFYKVNRQTGIMEYRYPSDADVMVYEVKQVSEEEFLRRNFEKFMLR